MPSVQTSLVIDAPADAIWRVLTDFGSHDAWNPVLKKMRGRASVGADLDFVLHIGPLRAPIAARVVCADGRELRWEGPRVKAFAPVARGSHYFRLEALDERRTRLVHGEEFGGPVFALPWKVLGPRVQKSYEALNHALAREVARRAP